MFLPSNLLTGWLTAQFIRLLYHNTYSSGTSCFTGIAKCNVPHWVQLGHCHKWQAVMPMWQWPLQESECQWVSVRGGHWAGRMDWGPERSGCVLGTNIGCSSSTNFLGYLPYWPQSTCPGPYGLGQQNHWHRFMSKPIGAVEDYLEAREQMLSLEDLHDWLPWRT